MKANNIYVLTIVSLNGEVFQEETQVKPTLEECYITNNGNFIRFETIIETNKVVDREFVRSYVTCIEKKPINNSLIGVTQTKFIYSPYGGVDSIEHIETELNEFLFETRFTHQILDISYTQSYVVVKYKLKNEIDTLKTEVKLESYQKNGRTINYKWNNCQYNLSEFSILEL